MLSEEGFRVPSCGLWVMGCELLGLIELLGLVGFIGVASDAVFKS